VPGAPEFGPGRGIEGPGFHGRFVGAAQFDDAMQAIGIRQALAARAEVSFHFRGGFGVQIAIEVV
jgi:hypothetical protein